MVTLGLDASTTCVGYAFTKNKRILDMGFIDIKKEKTPKEKVEKVIEYLNKTSENIITSSNKALIQNANETIEESNVNMQEN